MLRRVYDTLRRTGRGKHVGRFSYYHVRVAAGISETHEFLGHLLIEFQLPHFEYNVVKLDRRSRLSFLLYEDFSVPFPALERTLAINLERRTARVTDYVGRSNPPILHRKELLLPTDDSMVPEAALLTLKLEELGAFENSRAIGTRVGWAARLNSLGLAIEDGDLKVEA